jgi:hypothetical protein
MRRSALARIEKKAANRSLIAGSQLKVFAAWQREHAKVRLSSNCFPRSFNDKTQNMKFEIGLAFDGLVVEQGPQKCFTLPKCKITTTCSAAGVLSSHQHEAEQRC